MKHVYATSPDPHFCAMALDDRLLEKSIQDVLRIASATIGHYGGKAVFMEGLNPGPWDLWSRENYDNYAWFNSHLIYMSTEWSARGGGRGKHQSHGLILDLAKQRHLVPKRDKQTMFPNATAHQNLLDPTVAYRLHLSERWAQYQHPPVWGPAGPPPWIVKPSDLQRIKERLGCN